VVGLVDLLHLLVRQVFQRAVGVLVRVVLFRQLPVGLFDLLVAGGGGDPQHLVRICHTSLSPFRFPLVGNTRSGFRHIFFSSRRTLGSRTCKNRISRCTWGRPFSTTFSRMGP